MTEGDEEVEPKVMNSSFDFLTDDNSDEEEFLIKKNTESMESLLEDDQDINFQHIFEDEFIIKY